MFKNHNPVINEYMQESHDQMSMGIMFVVLSVKTPFHTMKRQMDDYKVNGVNSKYVWGFKIDTHNYLQDYGKELYDDLMQLWMTPKKEFGGTQDQKDAAMLLRLIQVPGLGAVKAGFVMQMMFGRVGCFDVHNLRRFRKVDPRDFKFADTAKPETKFAKLMNYVSLCKVNRSTEKLWDSWCEQLVYKPCNRGRFVDGNEVSQMHVTALIG